MCGVANTLSSVRKGETGKRLEVECIDRGAGDLLVLQPIDQSLLLDNRPARCIDQPGRRLHSLQLRDPYQAMRPAAQD